MYLCSENKGANYRAAYAKTGFFYYYLSLQLDVVPCGGRKSLPALIYSADYILLLVL